MTWTLVRLESSGALVQHRVALTNHSSMDGSMLHRTNSVENALFRQENAALKKSCAALQREIEVLQQSLLFATENKPSSKTKLTPSAAVLAPEQASPFSDGTDRSSMAVVVCCRLHPLAHDNSHAQMTTVMTSAHSVRSSSCLTPSATKRCVDRLGSHRSTSQRSRRTRTRSVVSMATHRQSIVVTLSLTCSVPLTLSRVQADDDDDDEAFESGY